MSCLLFVTNSYFSMNFMVTMPSDINTFLVELYNYSKLRNVSDNNFLFICSSMSSEYAYEVTQGLYHILGEDVPDLLYHMFNDPI